MQIKFQKMHGTMNDFVVLHDLTGEITVAARQVAAICDRRAGVGADGLIVVRKSDKADFFMDYMNSDGSLAEMCGNGIRCLAKYVYDSGMTDKTVLAVETRAGVKNLELLPGPDGEIERVRVDMGQPMFAPKDIPVNIETDETPILDYSIQADGEVFHAAFVSMGNPHCVIICDGDVETLPKRYGPRLEVHPIFPQKANVEFVSVVDRKRLLMRVWERGSGETWACGTGACAAMVAAYLKGFVDEHCMVGLKGGDLEINWKGTNYSVIMTGPAVRVFTGELTI